jgi:uncharacterized ferritin-like protein (DUF455 family)
MIITSKTFSAFAELVLSSNDLEDKLRAPDPAISDDGLSALAKFRTPELPGRAPGLSLLRPAKSGRSAFPGRSHLGDQRARGFVLHFFANHELLALELMALALLKWPDAPEGFRRGLVQTMIEEQNHMRLYLDRMKDLNVEFGEAPLNAFFWNSMRDLASPMEFAAAMAMTFEQANLDFALHYETLFRSEGDHVTADIMSRVRLEEIGHVKHGVIWFERWRPKCERLFKEWQGSLHWPMTPARAKGLLFDREGRLAAGLPQEFVDELEVHNQSKGRPPRVFWFNPGCEQEIEAGDLSWTPPKAIQALTADYGSLMGLLANKSDIVLVHHMPSVHFLKSLDRLGFDIPEFVLQQDLKTLTARKFTALEPWGWSPASRNFFAPLRPQVLGLDKESDRTPPTAKSSIFSKNIAADLREKMSLNTPATLRPNSMIEAERALDLLRSSSPSDTVVFKAPFSASGRGMIRIKEGGLSPKDSSWISSTIERHGFLLAEPWLDKWIDLSAHIDISKDGAVRFIGFTRFWTDLRGQYRGHVLGRLLDDAGSDVLRLWHSENGWQQTLRDTVTRVGHEAFQMGYYGPLGIDAFIYRSGEGFMLRPLVEINPRWSMGRVALSISSRLGPKRCGLWIHVSANEIKRSGHSNFSALVQALELSHVTEMVTNGLAKIIHQGVFSLNDPASSTQAIALLIVGKDLAECSGILSRAGINDPQLMGFVTEPKLSTPAS